MVVSSTVATFGSIIGILCQFVDVVSEMIDKRDSRVDTYFGGFGGGM